MPAGLVALAAMLPLALPRQAVAQSVIAAEVAKPVSLPDIAIGSPKAPVTITEYASMSCPHCAAFGENVFPMLRSRYIDTGKVRFVFREFPLDAAAAASSILARCISKNDPEKYLAVVETVFKLQARLMAEPKETLYFVGQQNGLSEKEVEACESDRTMIEKLSADQRFALDTLKVDSTPTFFINGQKYKGAMSYEELEALLKPLLKR
nr:DsbA family protein [Bradyrhizobium lablabi]